MLHLAGPEWEPIEAYYDCRYAVLRQPLGFERGAEVLNDDTEAIHAYIEIDQDIVAVGRSQRRHHFLHLIQAIGRPYRLDKWERSKHIEERASLQLSSKHLRRHPFNNLAQYAVFYKHVK